MKRLFVVGLGLMIVAVTGCNTSERGGGATSGTSFKIAAPATKTTIKQGESDAVKLTLDRGKDFKSDVQLKVSAPKGLNVNMTTTQVKASDGKEVSVTITADKDAPLGDHVVTVTGTPEKGSPTTVDFKVEVKEKERGRGSSLSRG